MAGKTRLVFNTLAFALFFIASGLLVACASKVNVTVSNEQPAHCRFVANVIETHQTQGASSFNDVEAELKAKARELGGNHLACCFSVSGLQEEQCYNQKGKRYCEVYYEGKVYHCAE
jgi:hypothetical protein